MKAREVTQAQAALSQQAGGRACTGWVYTRDLHPFCGRLRDRRAVLAVGACVCPGSTLALGSTLAHSTQLGNGKVQGFGLGNPLWNASAPRMRLQACGFVWKREQELRPMAVRRRRRLGWEGKG